MCDCTFLYILSLFLHVTRWPVFGCILKGLVKVPGNNCLSIERERVDLATNERPHSLLTSPESEKLD